MKAYVAVQKKILEIIYTLWKKDQAYQTDYNQDVTSGNDESRVLFPFLMQEKKNETIKVVVPPIGSTTQDEHRYKESSEVLFPYNKIKKKSSKWFAFSDSTFSLGSLALGANSRPFHKQQLAQPSYSLFNQFSF